MSRQTQRDRQHLKSELAYKFDQWNRMTDGELLTETQKRWPAVNEAHEPTRGELLKFLVMDHLDKLN